MYLAVSRPPNPPKPVFGSFEHAEIVRAQQMAKLTPLQRVRMVCSMNAIAKRTGAKAVRHR
jgi:hypothetical protein